MKTHKRFFIILISLVATHFLFAGLSFSSGAEIDGELRNGYRILTLSADKPVQNFVVYRGDYLKFRFPGAFEDPVIAFPTLNEKKRVSRDIDNAAYIKMKQIGAYPFEINAIKGTITVIEYHQSSYSVLSAKQAAAFIQSENPLILDVRTLREFKAGHLENSVLIPVQELQSRYKELDAYKNQPILIYCATGNRSTVASKILIDRGFNKILNLGRGIVDWAREKYPVVR